VRALPLRRARCHRCHGLRYSSRGQVLRWLYHVRVRAMKFGPLDDAPLEARETLREQLVLTGQLAGLCAGCAAEDATTALAGAKRRKRRAAA
jgi:hypothetical protein